MGYLHEGHLTLIDEAKKYSDIIVASIFVNPIQFAPTEDLAQYPRDFSRDTHMLEKRGCTILFNPTVDEMYPTPFVTSIHLEGLATKLEGEFRPTHFSGVATVVAKLLNIVQPDHVFFGQKDAQQCVVIKQMVRDLNICAAVHIIPTVRESDGLAMSSRNIYLNPEQRNNAIVLYQSMQTAATLIHDGETSVRNIVAKMETMIKAKSETKIDYINIVDAHTLDLVESILHNKELLILLAVRVGKTRLIDNMLIHT